MQRRALKVQPIRWSTAGLSYHENIATSTPTVVSRQRTRDGKYQEATQSGTPNTQPPGRRPPAGNELDGRRSGQAASIGRERVGNGPPGYVSFRTFDYRGE